MSDKRSTDEGGTHFWTGKAPWTRDAPQARLPVVPRPMIRVGFEPSVLVLARLLSSAIFVGIVPILFVTVNLAADRYDAGMWSGQFAWGFVLGLSFAVPISLTWVIYLLVLPARRRHRRSMETIGVDPARATRSFLSLGGVVTVMGWLGWPFAYEPRPQPWLIRQMRWMLIVVIGLGLQVAIALSLVVALRWLLGKSLLP